ncbi:hypothetical protein CHCC20495_1482 [Bacillus licheniformis]|nr:hypothetical protein CHCC20495_1482 [Bacillus licheniformis]
MNYWRMEPQHLYALQEVTSFLNSKRKMKEQTLLNKKE